MAWKVLSVVVVAVALSVVCAKTQSKDFNPDEWEVVREEPIQKQDAGSTQKEMRDPWEDYKRQGYGPPQVKDLTAGLKQKIEEQRRKKKFLEIKSYLSTWFLIVCVLCIMAASVATWHRGNVLLGKNIHIKWKHVVIYADCAIILIMFIFPPMQKIAIRHGTVVNDYVGYSFFMNLLGDGKEMWAPSIVWELLIIQTLILLMVGAVAYWFAAKHDKAQTPLKLTDLVK